MVELVPPVGSVVLAPPNGKGEGRFKAFVGHLVLVRVCSLEHSELITSEFVCFFSNMTRKTIRFLSNDRTENNVPKKLG